MPAWAMISCAAGYAVDEAREVVGDRREPASTVDEDRYAPLGRDREHRREALVVEHELLRARVQLDAARAAVEAALGFVDGIFGQVEPDEGDHPAVRARGEFERAVVARAKARMPVRLVEAEDVAPRDPVAVHGRLELLEASGHPVDVVAEVRVCVEDVGARGQFGAELRLEGRKELFCSFERFAHPLNLPMWAYSNAGASTRSRKTRSGTAPSHCGTPLTTIRGTDQTSIESASAGNSVASIAAERIRGEASATLYASSTAGGQCGQVGVTKTSIARSRSSAARRSSDSGRSDDSLRPASMTAPISEPSS